MSAPHEPIGAWRVSCMRRTMDGQSWYRIVSENDWEIAYVPFGDRTDEEYRRCTEHSRLIAAAPDMYEALRPFAEHPDFHASDDWPVTFKDAEIREPGVTAGDFRRARAALRKVRGEQP